MISQAIVLDAVLNKNPHSFLLESRTQRSLLSLRLSIVAGWTCSDSIPHTRKSKTRFESLIKISKENGRVGPRDSLWNYFWLVWEGHEI